MIRSVHKNNGCVGRKEAGSLGSGVTVQRYRGTAV